MLSNTIARQQGIDGLTGLSLTQAVVVLTIVRVSDWDQCGYFRSKSITELVMTILTAFRVGQGVRIDGYSKNVHHKNGDVFRTAITKQLEDLLGTKLRVEEINREWFLYYG